MKKLIVHTLIALYLIGTTELSQLLKLGYFIEHYIEHKSANEKLSLLQFIDIHYVQPTVIDDDYAEDMQLPFKTHNDCHAFSNISLLLHPSNSFSSEIHQTEQKINYLDLNSPSFENQFLDEIFQPPRAA